MFTSALCCCNASARGTNRHDETAINEKTNLLSSPHQPSIQTYQTPGPLLLPPSRPNDPFPIANDAIQALVLHNDFLPLLDLNLRLGAALQSDIHETSWVSDLAESILNRLAEALQPGSPIGDAMRDLYEDVRAAALETFGWLREHPEVIAIVVALGILMVLAPWVITALGFGEEGVIVGSWAARWQSMYEGFVEARSWFAWLQSIGARYGKKL